MTSAQEEVEEKIERVVRIISKGARQDGFNAKDLLAYPHQENRYILPAKEEIRNLLSENTLAVIEEVFKGVEEVVKQCCEKGLATEMILISGLPKLKDQLKEGEE